MAAEYETAELEFFKWLPGAVAPTIVQDIRRSYIQINALLIKFNALPRALMGVKTVNEVEYALRRVKDIFANKKLRNTAVSLLSSYLTYLQRDENISIEQETSRTIEVQSSWVKSTLKNVWKFEGTVPIFCAIAGVPIEGKNWARILVSITEHEISNPMLKGLYEHPLVYARKGRPYFMSERIEGLNCTQLSNGYWICLNYSIPQLITMIWTLCLICGYTADQIVLYGIPKQCKTGTNKGDTEGGQKEGNNFSSRRGISIEKLEQYLISTSLKGATVEEMIRDLQPGAAVLPTVAALDGSMNIISMPGNRYVHVSSFVDLDEAEEVMRRILKTHFVQFGGYSNSQLLFGAAAQELSLFLNDNDCENIDSVYAIARFLFEKKGAVGASYKFFTPHIFEKEPDYPMNLRGLMIHLARNNGGILYVSDAKDYLNKVLLNYGSIGQLLQLGSSNTFLIYDSERYLLSESLEINDAWCCRMRSRLDDLFRNANVAYIIPRDISAEWLTTLPSLPHNLNWTHLLLQEVLRKYPSIGFKSISSCLSQSHDTLAAAFVPAESQLQTFPDIVTLFMEEHFQLPIRMSSEELRQELRKAGMLENGEMIYSLSKALDDYRFAWSNENKTVYVRGNK